jgi:hypothetical protein
MDPATYAQDESTATSTQDENMSNNVKINVIPRVVAESNIHVKYIFTIPKRGWIFNPVPIFMSKIFFKYKNSKR